jgi:hypothetical protein
MNPKNTKMTVVDEVSYGLYLWQMPDGSLVTDEDGNHMNIAAIKGDIRKINALKDFAKSWGVEEGKPVWFSGHRQVTSDEYEEQKQRLEWGLIPDELDVPAIKEDLVQKKKMGII